MSSFPTIKKLLSERLEIPEENILPQTNLESLNVDSLTLIELIFDLEDEFHIKIGDERPSLVTMQDLTDYIDGYINKKVPE